MMYQFSIVRMILKSRSVAIRKPCRCATRARRLRAWTVAMATDRDFKIIRTMEKLNHIIHRSR